MTRSVAPALADHADPPVAWDVAGRFRTSPVPRSQLDDRFRHVPGRPLIRYPAVRERMRVSDDFLTSTDLAVFVIARRVGYES